MKIDKEHFLKCLIHRWDNIKQAQRNPNEYTHCHYDWCVEGNILKSKQWYHWNEEVYRERTNKISVEDDKIILTILESGLDVIFELDHYNNGGYIGGVSEGTYNDKGIKVESRITLDQRTYTSFDQGIDKDGNIIWGDVSGPFIFQHT
jgi:hypothetical protein